MHLGLVNAQDLDQDQGHIHHITEGDRQFDKSHMSKTSVHSY